MKNNKDKKYFMNKCIWCESETTNIKKNATENIKYANLEHIFPEAVGGIKTLPQGIVCEDCNHRLGLDVDQYLRKENFIISKGWQDSSVLLEKPMGKIRNPKDRERKVAQQTSINAHSGGTIIERDKENSNIVKFINLADGSGGDFNYYQNFSKALHKCAVNVLLDHRGCEYVKSNYEDLINFVNNKENNNFHSWSYAVSYANIFSQIHFEPFCLNSFEIHDIGNNIKGESIVLVFPTAIFIVCIKSNFLNINLLKNISFNDLISKKLERYGDLIQKYFNANCFSESRNFFGDKIKFALIKKEIKGKPNPKDSFYLLTKCRTCGQINPTRIMLSKNIILGDLRQSAIHTDYNGWNHHSREDIDILYPDTNC